MPDPDAALRLPPVRGALAELDRLDAVERLHARDASLWTADPEVAAAVDDRLGWLDVAAGMPTADIDALVAGVAADGLSRVVLAGMGGSSLAPEVFARVFEGQVQGLHLDVLDSTHPGRVRATLHDADPAATLAIVSSKSGGTTETAAFAAAAEAVLPGPRHLAAITDPGSPLDEAATAAGYRAVLRNPPDIGGRFSALSRFGMAPAALVGVDLDAVWARGAALRDRCLAPAHDNPGAQLGAFMAGLARAGRDKLTLLAPPWLEPLGDWVEQLVAESTGKTGAGVIPVVGEPLGAPDVYGDDRAFVAFRVAGASPAPVEELAAAGHPILVLDVDEPADIGAEFVRWEVATAFAGALLGVNPFDEPDVAAAKRATANVLAEVADGAPVPAPQGPSPAEAALAAAAELRAGDYLAIQAFCEPTAEAAATLARARTALRESHHVAVTIGWGPRFLHSTGQLHKGGPDRLVALQLTDTSVHDAEAVDVPGQPYDFATLLSAQAAGDRRALEAAGRRVIATAITGADDLVALADAAVAGTR